jgi:xylulokinase
MGSVYFIGIDIGTSGSKGVLVDVHGKIAGYKFAEHKTESPKPGWLEHDADAAWWKDLVEITRSVLQQSGIDPRDVKAIAVSGLAPEMLPVDDSGRPLRKALIYSDARARSQVQTVVEAMRKVGAPEAFVAGQSALAVGPKILWFRENEPLLFARTHKIHTCSSYLVSRLTGRSVVDQLTAMMYSPLFDPFGQKWDQRLCSELGIALDLLPEVSCRWASDIAGRVTKEAAAETGLAEGTLVTAGTADGFADFLSTGAVEVGESSLIYGTTMLFSLVTSADVARPSTFPAPIPGMGSSLGGATSAAGALTTWFRSNFGQREQEAERSLGLNAYQLMSLEAEDIPAGSEGLVVLPYFAGERSPINDSAARGLVIGLTLSHTRRHIYRAMLEAIAYSVRHVHDSWKESGGDIRRIVATGGGTKSRLWTQIVSDVTGKDQDVVKFPIGAPYGDAFLAAYGAGVFSDLSALRGEWAPAVYPVRHDPVVTRIYDQYYRIYRELYENNKGSMHELVALASSAH